MSRFTGRADFADLVESAESVEDFYLFKDTKIYMNDAEVRIDRREDLYQFYPFVIASMASSKENGRRRYTINLAKEPSFDTDERSSLVSYLIGYLDILKDSRKGEPDEEIYSRWLEERKDDFYDKDIMRKVFDRLGSCISKKRKFAKMLNSSAVDIRLRNQILDAVAAEHLYGIHLERYQRQRKEFVDWYDSMVPESISWTVENIRGKLGEW